MDFDNLTGDCPNCHHGSAFQMSRRLRIWPREYMYGQSSPIGPPEGHVWVDLRVYLCLHCNNTTTYREQWALLPSEGDNTAREARLIHREMVYPNPSPRELHETVPDGIRSLYREASKCEQAGALRAAGVMYRAVVEELVKERGATGKDLYTKIESAEEVADIANLIEEATVTLYVQPEERRRMRDARKARRDAAKANKS